MVKFELLEALKEGMINVVQLKEQDQYLLVLITSDQQFIIPMIKSSKSCSAYIPTSVDADTYTMLDVIIEALNNQKVYKGMYTYKPILMNAPAHSQEVANVVKPSIGDYCAENLQEVVEAAGYKWFEEIGNGNLFNVDYEEIRRNNPEFQKIYEENQLHLQKIGATFDSLNDETKTAFESLKCDPDMVGIIFEGPTGTGKSVGAMVIANELGAPLLNLQISYGTSIDDLLGTFVPNDKDKMSPKDFDEVQDLMDKYRDGKISAQQFFDVVGSLTSGESAKWTFKPGLLLVAYCQGACLVLEEVNFGQAGVLAKINEFTDDTLRVTYNGETYRRHPGFKIFMTMNPGYKGTDPLNSALKNRFAKVNIPALSKEEFTRRAQIHSKNLGHELQADFFSKLYDFAAFIEKEGETSKWHEDVKFSIRNCKRLCSYILAASRSFEEFNSAIAIQYLNDLATDNDNSEKLEAFKKETEIVDKIRDIFSSYDFASVKTKKAEKSFGSFFSEEEEKPNTSKKDTMDDLLNKFDRA